jgi:hypothetical protein
VDKFPVGQVVITAHAKDTLDQRDVDSGLGRHRTGDWGDVCAADANENELSLRDGLRLFSVYHASDGTKFWIITEADRSVTTILLPEDY